MSKASITDDQILNIGRAAQWATAEQLIAHTRALLSAQPAAEMPIVLDINEALLGHVISAYADRFGLQSEDVTENDIVGHVCEIIANYQIPSQQTRHNDDIAVYEFADAMVAKMAEARAKGRSGWEECDPVQLSIYLREHVEKGDPRDVANFCMMLWHHEAPISDAALPMGKRAAASQEPTGEQL